MEKLKKYITRFDSFGVNIPFRMDGNKKHKSFLGGIMNVFYYSLTIAYLTFNFYTYVSFDSMTILQADFRDENPISINLYEDGLMFAVSYRVNGSPSNVLTEYVDFVGESTEQRRNNSINRDTKKSCRETPCKNKIKLDINRPCNARDFNVMPVGYSLGESLGSKETGSVLLPYVSHNYNSLNMKEYLDSIGNDQSWKCPEYKVNIAGQFTSDYFSYYTFSMRIKKNLTTEQIAKLSETLQRNEVSVNIRYVDVKLDIKNYTAPISQFINEIYFPVDFESTRKINIYLEKTQINTDNNPFIAITNEKDYRISMAFVSKSVEKDEQVWIKGQDRMDPSLATVDSDILLSVYLRSSMRRHLIERTYYKLIQFIADTTSVTGIIYAFFFSLISSMNEYQSFEILMKKSVKFKGNLLEDEPDFQEFKNLFGEEVQMINPRKSSLMGYRKNSSLAKLVVGLTDKQASDRKQEEEVSAKTIQINGNNEYKGITGIEDAAPENNVKIDENDNKNEDPGLKIELVSVPRSNNFITPATIIKESMKENNIEKSEKENNQTESDISDNYEKEKENEEEETSGAANIYVSLPMTKIFFIVVKKYLTYFIKPCYNYKSKKDLSFQLYSKIKKKMFYYLDLITYIRKLHEVEVLKYIVLNNDQRRMFNFVVKPTVDLVKSDIFDLIRKKCDPVSDVSKNEFEKLHESYEKIKENEDDQIDRRLTQLADAEIQRLLNN